MVVTGLASILEIEIGSRKTGAEGLQLPTRHNKDVSFEASRINM
jgi:hypothetical protein